MSCSRSRRMVISSPRSVRKLVNILLLPVANSSDAINKTSVIFRNSDGWNWTGPMRSHLRAPLTSWPSGVKRTARSISTLRANAACTRNFSARSDSFGSTTAPINPASSRLIPMNITCLSTVE